MIGGKEKQISYKEAAELAEKGIKYDAVSPLLSVLKALAKRQKKSLEELVSETECELNEKHKTEVYEKCSGNAELAESFLALEATATCEKENSLSEISGFFPDIKQASDLPFEVTAAAEEKGTQLLDEYLRYLLKRRLSTEKHIKNQTKAQSSSIGSQRDADTSLYDPIKTEFIKGLWNK